MDQDVYRKWKENVQKYQIQQEKWKRDDAGDKTVAVAGCTNKSMSSIPSFDSLPKNPEADKLLQLMKATKEVTLSGWTRDMLDPYYQQLIRNHSPTYLKLCEWYIGPSLVNNPLFIFPIHDYIICVLTGFPVYRESDWRRSCLLVDIIRNRIQIQEAKDK